MVSEYRICYLDSSGKGAIEYIQALSARNAADITTKSLGATLVLEVARVVKGWRKYQGRI